MLSFSWWSPWHSERILTKGRFILSSMWPFSWLTAATESLTFRVDQVRCFTVKIERFQLPQWSDIQFCQRVAIARQHGEVRDVGKVHVHKQVFGAIEFGEFPDVGEIQV